MAVVAKSAVLCLAVWVLVAWYGSLVLLDSGASSKSRTQQRKRGDASAASSGAGEATPPTPTTSAETVTWIQKCPDPEIDPYRILCVHREVTQAEIKKA